MLIRSSAYLSDVYQLESFIAEGLSGKKSFFSWGSQMYLKDFS